MRIPPVSPPDKSQGSGSDPLVQKFNELWDDWYDDPTRQTGQVFLDFLTKNHDYFAQIAKNAPLPHPLVSFEQSYSAAEQYMQGWLSHGCDPGKIVPPSEFIADVAKWINYAEG